MFFQLLKKTILPFGLPLALIVAVYILARRRVPFLRTLPLWLWLAIILAIVFIWILVIVLSWWNQHRRAKAIEAGIMKQAQWNAENAAPGRRAEIEEIRKNLGEALVMLRRGPEGKKALYSLPWYMIIGPPAIGKTTAIVNSGLNFPGMTTARRMRGAGGTRNCDWWFSTDAILLDTAGRYAQSADRSETEPEWFGFLDLLRKHRSSGPINGLLLGYSVETLIEADENRLISDARELRERMDEIMDRLGWTFPVYVVFTKCDLIAGFADFYSSLSPVERQQVWGATYPLAPSHDQDAAGRFGKEFDLLCHRIRELRIRRMAALGGGDAWGRTFMFPEEFSALRGKLHLFIETLFEPNPFKKDVPLFRGTYFTSGKQVGKPFDLIAKKIQAMLGLGATVAGPPPQPEKEDAYFVRDIFTKVLKGDRELLRRTHAAGAQWAKVQFAGSAALMALSILACLWITVSCSRLGGKMETTRAMAVSVRGSGAAAGPDVKTLDELDRLRRSIRGSWQAFPLNVANSVRDTALMVYLNAARQRVLDPVEEEIASDLDRPRGLNADQARRALRAELMLVDPAHYQEIGEPADLSTVIGEYGFKDLDPGGPPQKELDGIIDEFLKKGTPLRSFESRRGEIESGAERLDQTHERNEYFDGIVSSASRCAADLNLKTLAGGQTILLAPDDAVVRAAFTNTGWQKCVSDAMKNVNRTMQADLKLIDKAGVKPRQEAPTQKELMRLYIEQFPEEWQAFLSTVHLRSYNGCADAVGDLKELKKRKSSPLMRLIDGAVAEAKVSGGVVEGLVGSDVLDQINQEMQPLVGFGTAAKDEDAPSDEYAKQLGDVYDQIAQCAQDPTVGFDNKVLIKAETWADDYADRYPGSSLAGALARLLKQPVVMTQGVVQTQGTIVAQGGWDKDVVSFYKDRLAGKYPFNPSSTDMASADDVIKFFGQDGILDAFGKSLAAAKKEPSPDLKACLDAASDIRGWLKMSSGSLKSSFTVEAGEVRAVAGSQTGEANNRRIDQTVLTIAGTTLTDQRAGASKTFTWASDADNTDCSLTLLNYAHGNQKVAGRDYSSLWAICQLFDDARAKKEGGGTKLTWTFEDEGIEVDYVVTMKTGGECPFLRNSTFRNFDKLFPASVVE